MYVLRWPKVRPLVDDDGAPWQAVMEPGRLTLTSADAVLTFSDVGELRAFAMQVYAAAIEYDQQVQADAVAASLERRRLRGLGGLRHQPFTEPAEPPMHMEVPA